MKQFPALTQFSQNHVPSWGIEELFHGNDVWVLHHTQEHNFFLIPTCLRGLKLGPIQYFDCIFFTRQRTFALINPLAKVTLANQPSRTVNLKEIIGRQDAPTQFGNFLSCQLPHWQPIHLQMLLFFLNPELQLWACFRYKGEFGLSIIFPSHLLNLIINHCFGFSKHFVGCWVGCDGQVPVVSTVFSCSRLLAENRFTSRRVQLCFTICFPYRT